MNDEEDSMIDEEMNEEEYEHDLDDEHGHSSGTAGVYYQDELSWSSTSSANGSYTGSQLDEEVALDANHDDVVGPSSHQSAMQALVTTSNIDGISGGTSAPTIFSMSTLQDALDDDIGLTSNPEHSHSYNNRVGVW